MGPIQAQFYGEIEDIFNQLAPLSEPLLSVGAFKFLDQDFARTRLHIYMALANDLLQFVKESENRYRASFEINFSFFDKGGELISSDIYEQEILAEDYRTTNARHPNHFYYYTLSTQPGTYKLRVELTDLDTRKARRQEMELELKRFSQDTLTVSDVLFLRYGDQPVEIRYLPPVGVSIDTTKPFFRNLPYLPVAGFWQESRYFIPPDFYAYFEMYTPYPGDSVEVFLTLYKAFDQVALRRRYTYKLTEKITPQLIPFNLQLLKPGPYRMHWTFVYRGKLRHHVTLLFVLTSPQPAFSAAHDLKASLGPLRYIASPAEYQAIVQAEGSEKERLFEEFWKKRDPTPETARNELREEFYRRVDFANRYFSSLLSGKAGWQTDRGRIFIIYGPPQNVERVTPHPTLPPREIWTYNNVNLTRRYLFIFRPNLGDFQLVAYE